MSRGQALKPPCLLTCLQVTCCAPCSTLSVTWLVTGCTRERFTRWCTTTTLTGLSQCCCWSRCLGISASTSTPSPSPARKRTTSPVSHFRKYKAMCLLKKLASISEVKNSKCAKCWNNLSVIDKWVKANHWQDFFFSVFLPNLALGFCSVHFYETNVIYLCRIATLHHMYIQLKLQRAMDKH